MAVLSDLTTQYVTAAPVYVAAAPVYVAVAPVFVAAAPLTQPSWEWIVTYQKISTKT